jgi:hypothetical protein
MMAPTETPLTLELRPERLAVCRLDPQAPFPDWASLGRFYSLTRTEQELSIVCEESYVPPGVTCEPAWRALTVAGPLAFELIGILAGLAGALSCAGVSLFALSTYDTDTLLIQEANLARALAALKAAGYVLHTNSNNERPLSRAGGVLGDQSES